MAWSRDTLWRQGSVLSQGDFQRVDLTETSDAGLAIAISHDCDIANDNLSAEPYVEFILGRIREKADGNCTYGKNPRKLHLEYTNAGKPVFIELIASEKRQVSKDLLESVHPDHTYEIAGSLQILQSWLAARYRRHALPNSLVERLRPVFIFIEKEGKKNSSGILSFRLSYDPQEELSPNEPYELWLSIVYVTDKEEYCSMAEEIAQKLNAKFPDLLNETKDNGPVDLRQCEAVSETEFTLRDMRDTVEYHAEHLSYRSDPPGPIAYGEGYTGSPSSRE